MSSRLQEYNQILLATIGTISLVGLFLLLVFIVIELGIFDSRDSLSKSIVIDNVDNKRPKNFEQVVSFSEVVVIDSTHGIYMLPISHVNIRTNSKKPEEISFYEGYGKRVSSYFKYSGEFNNIVIYESKTKSSFSVFDSTIFIDRIDHYRISNTNYLIIRGTNEDSNNDGLLDENDLFSLFLFRLSDRLTSKINSEGQSFRSFQLMQNSEDFIVEYGIDANNNGTFESGKEPQVLKRLMLPDEIEDLIDAETMKTLELNFKK